MAHTDAEHFRAFFEVAQTVTSTLSLPQVLNLVAQSVTRALGAKACSIHLRVDLGEKLELGAAYGLRERYLAKGPVELAKSGVDREALEGKVVMVRDVAHDPRIQDREEMIQEGITSLVVFPLSVRGMNIGVLRIYTADLREFDQREIDFVTAIASICALAIENARVYETLEDQFEAIRRAKIPWAEDFNKPHWRD